MGGMRRTRILRLLRIAASVVCGILCLLLIALWVRSYSSHSAAMRVYRTSDTLIVVSDGWAHYFEWGHAPTYRTQPWRFETTFFDRYKLKSAINISENRVHVPLWSLVLVMGATATLPWIPWSNRFSLRTLLIAMTLVAAVLGLIVYAAGN
jgi:hypothetical protein